MELGLTLEMEISGRAFTIWYYVELGDLWWINVLNSALPPQRHRPDTQLEHQDPVSHTADQQNFKSLTICSFGKGVEIQSLFFIASEKAKGYNQQQLCLYVFINQMSNANVGCRATHSVEESQVQGGKAECR